MYKIHEFIQERLNYEYYNYYVERCEGVELSPNFKLASTHFCSRMLYVKFFTGVVLARTVALYWRAQWHCTGVDQNAVSP